jgi:hypothetical protein
MARSYPSGSADPYQPNIALSWLDVTEELVGNELSYFHSQIGILRWIVELGRIDIIAEVSCLASCLALPRKGHLEAVFHLFAYLKKKPNGVVVLDPTFPDIDLRKFNDGMDRKDIYGDIKEPIPSDDPLPRGKTLITCLFVDSDHAGDVLTRRSELALSFTSMVLLSLGIPRDKGLSRF